MVVAGLGPAGADLLTAATLDAVQRIGHQYLRTSRHPSAAAAPAATTFDSLYEEAGSLQEVYRGIVERLVVAAFEHGEVLYLVPGSPAVGERSVQLLRADERVAVEVLVAPSFLDLAWARLGDPLESGVRLVDGQRFAEEAAGERGPLLVLQCDSRLVLTGVKLALEQGPPLVTVLQRLGLPDERVFEVAWDDLDRAVDPDHLTSLWIPALSPVPGVEVVRLADLVRTLRERCPWDRQQTHQSLTRHLLEETYEVLEAIERLDGTGGYEHLEEELGDLLVQVCFHTTLAAEAGHFTLADVARRVHDKLVNRHPHVFGSVQVDTAAQVAANWEEIKKAEKGRQSIMEGITGSLPSLLYADKIQRKAASAGFDWESADGTYAKVAEEAAELRADPSEEELGDLLFAVVNVARHLGLDPEAALRGATAKFRDRFMAVERLAADRSLDLRALDLAGLDALWDEVKRSP